MLEYISANLSGNGLDALLFMLSLDNPIAYEGATGYVAHGDSVSSTYEALGDPSGVVFTMTPLEISQLAVGFLTN